MSDLPFDQGSGKTIKERWPAEAHEGAQAHADGMRAYDNPYSAHLRPDQFAAWRDGWEYAESEDLGEEDDDGEDY